MRDIVYMREQRANGEPEYPTRSVEIFMASKMSIPTTELFPLSKSSTPLDKNILNYDSHSRKSSLIEFSNSNRDHVNNDTSLNDIVNAKHKQEVYRYETDWLVSTLAWSNEPGESIHLAVGSYIEDYNNKVRLVSLAKDEPGGELQHVSEFEHPYPATKILWIPRTIGNSAQLPRLLATSADYLRLWRIKEDSKSISSSDSDGALQETSEKVDVELECVLNANRGTQHCAPITSFDWNDIDPTIIVTASVDTTCAIWDIEVNKLISTPDSPTNQISEPCKLRAQVLAHNHEVYDVAFSRSGSGRDIFISASGDGSVRLFDLRKLSTSTVLYETNRSMSSDRRALVRVACNKQDSNLISSFGIQSNDIILLDTRKPGQPLVVLSSHTANINSMSWAPHSAHHICSASDDQQALIWELTRLPGPIDEPLLAYRASGKINVINWSASHPDWIAVGFKNHLELLRV